jgi:hypothetical protein
LLEHQKLVVAHKLLEQVILVWKLLEDQAKLVKNQQCVDHSHLAMCWRLTLTLIVVVPHSMLKPMPGKCQWQHRL